MGTLERLKLSLGVDSQISRLISNTDPGMDSIAEVYQALYELHQTSLQALEDLESQIAGMTGGYTGAQGIQGTIGVQGIQGTIGEQGIQGYQGPIGAQGIQGFIGEQGSQGIQGIQGTIGEQGIQGAIGTRGIQGAIGAQGIQGIQGSISAQGIQGIQGSIGTQGIQGSIGTQGSIGAQGIQGTVGTQGTQGTQGSTGATGSNFIPNLSPLETFRGQTHRNNSTTIDTYGGITTSTSASNLAQSVSTSTFASRHIRLRYYASVVSTGRYTGVRGSSQQFWSVTGGFRYVCDFNISDTAFGSGCQNFFGLGAYNADLNYGGLSNLSVSSLTNIIGIGNDANDTNLQVIYNDGTGSASKIDLGSSFPANRTSGAASTTVYSIQLYNEPGSTSVLYEVVNNETGAVSQGTLISDLPASSQLLNFFASRAMGGGGGITNSGQFDLLKLGVYSVL